MPKDSVVGSQFNRSILILTPERALKFTATSQERHYVWLTALSFLSHSLLSVGEMIPLPPMAEEQDPSLSAPSFASSFSNRQILDSVRVAKSGSRAGTGPRSFTTDGSLPVRDVSRPSTRDFYDPSLDPALPPTIKRYHHRNRSNTAPRPPPNSFRATSTRDVVPVLPEADSTYSQSNITTTDISSNRGVYTPSLGVQSIASSRRGSETSGSARPQLNSFFSDSSKNGTMRMDAFVDNSVSTPGKMPPRGKPKAGSMRKDMKYWGFEEGGQSNSPLTSLVNRDMMTSSSTRGSTDRDPFTGF